MVLRRLIGLGGIPCGETLLARRIGRYFDYLSILVIVVLAWQWHLDVRDSLGTSVNVTLNLCVWMYFVIQVAVGLYVVEEKKRYIKTNWLLIPIIVAGIPFIMGYTPPYDVLEYLRPLFAAVLIIPWVTLCQRALSDGRLGTTIIVAIIIIFLAGIVISGFDPGIPTPLDGIWWAWVTVSTVGYGDVVPVSWVGRIFAALLILMGLALFSAITANFAAIFVRRDFRDVKLDELHFELEAEEEILLQLKELQSRLERMEEKLDKRK